jgi:ATP-dependent helicase HrpA
MREEDILLNEPDTALIDLYPDQVQLGHIALPCSYRFAPSTPDDGVTISIPAQLLSSIPVEAVDWAVPGLLKDKIFALIKGLPKEYRKKLQPLAQTSGVVYEALALRPHSLPPGEDKTTKPGPPSKEKDWEDGAADNFHNRGSLITAMGKFIREHFGIAIPASAWSYDGIEDHIKTRVAVIDAEGRILTTTRDISLLQRDIVEDVETALFAEARHKWEKKGLTDWDFGDLPEVIYLGKAGDAAQGCAFPALEARDGGTDLGLFKTRAEAAAAHQKGVVALYKIHFKHNLNHLKKAIAITGEMKIWAPHLSGVKPLEKSLIEKVMQDLFGENIRNRSSFLQLAEKMGPHILTRGQEVLRDTRPILQAYYETITVFKNLEKTYQANKPALKYLALMQDELQQLLPHHFLEIYDAERLTHMPRYLKALRIRADRGLLHLEKAHAKEAEVRAIAKTLEDARSNCPPYASAEKRRAIDEYARMIEEYKVSIFAQELKTAFPVSRKRLDQKCREIEEMA